MATQSPSSNPTNPITDDNPSSNPASQPFQETTNNGQTTADLPNEISPKSVFVNSQPIREDQVQNAVKFLSHPRVKGSPVIHRRNFLERKGLTKEEIDEAFRRVPDEAPTGATGQTGTNPDTNATSIQTHAPVQAIQPTSSTSISTLSTVRRKFHWSHAVYAVGFFAISGAGTALLFKKTIIPRFKSWIRRVVLEEEVVIEQKIVVEDAAKAAKAAAVTASDLAKAVERMLNSKDEEKKRFMDFLNNLLDMQTQEIKAMRSSIARLEGQLYSVGRNPVREEYIDGSVARSSSMQQPLERRSGLDTRSVRSVSPPPSTEPPHPKSYMEIMAMVQRGERPPNVRDIDDRPPNPNQPISNPSLAPKAKPWEVTQTTYNSNSISHHQVPSENGSRYISQDNGVTHHSNNEGSPPWWQQKNVKITEVDNNNVPNVGSVSNGIVNIDNPPQRRWVPPQPPPVSMPEAAEAIRHPKSGPKDVNPKNEGEVQGVNDVDELQRITKISEFGGQLELSGRSGSSEKIASEIIEEEQVSEI